MEGLPSSYKIDPATGLEAAGMSLDLGKGRPSNYGGPFLAGASFALPLGASDWTLMTPFVTGTPNNDSGTGFLCPSTTTTESYTPFCDPYPYIFIPKYKGDFIIDVFANGFFTNAGNQGRLIVQGIIENLDEPNDPNVGPYPGNPILFGAYGIVWNAAAQRWGGGPLPVGFGSPGFTQYRNRAILKANNRYKARLRMTRFDDSGTPGITMDFWSAFGMQLREIK